MTFFRLVRRNLLYHWRGNAAVFLGVVVGTAVLTGALLVGDSLRGSLADLTLRRLGWISRTLVAPRFFREKLADELGLERVAPAIVLRGTAVAQGRTVRKVNIYGVDVRFWGGPPPGAASAEAVVLNRTLADDLGLKAGDSISVRVQKPGDVPRESLLGRRGDAAGVDELPFTVAAVLGPDDFGQSFGLAPSTEAPRNVFVPLHSLQEKLKQPDRVNALFAAQSDAAVDVASHLTLDDWGLTLTSPGERVDALFRKLDRNGDGRLSPSEWRDRLAESVVAAIDPKKGTLTRSDVTAYYERKRNYLNLESRQLLIEPVVADAARQAAQEIHLSERPTLVYLANTLAADGRDIPYSVVAALDLGKLAPSTPFTLKDDEIALVDWKDSPLAAPVVATVLMTYFAPEQHGDPKVLTAEFKLAGRIPLAGPTADPDLTPELPGLTDATSITNWDPPPPFDRRDIARRIKNNDENERYWKDYRTTPKAYITLAAGQKLWGSRFGDLTSIRFAADSAGQAKSLPEDEFRRSLLGRLDPRRGGFTFDDVRAEALEASRKGTDFSTLFLGFSMFLIAAALLLVILLFRLNLDRRASEIGLMLAAGYRRSVVRRLLLAEGTLIACAGVIVGNLLALAYCALLVRFLAALWPGGALESFLRPHVTVFSLLVGGVSSLLASGLSIAWAVRSLGGVAPSALLMGRVGGDDDAGVPGRTRWSKLVAATSLIIGVALLLAGGAIRDPEAQAGAFFGGGALLLTAALAAAWVVMRSTRRGVALGHGFWGVGRLGVRNAARYPTRSLLTAGLLASAAFLVVAVEAFRRHAGAAESGRDSPSGGFTLLAESDLPVFQDLNSAAGRDDLTARLETYYQDKLNDPAAVKAKLTEAAELLRQVTVYPFRVRSGDDASCLNLYQPRKPRVLGAPPVLIDRGGFVFASSAAADDAEKKNPWKILQRPRPDDQPMPAFGEKESVEWMLKPDADGLYRVPTDRGGDQPLRVDGLLQDSVFQSGLIISEANFLHIYPGHEGYNFFLIESPPGREDDVIRLLEAGLADRGFAVTRTAERLATYQAVVNTYISTFEALGGLGLVLGSLGLAVVLLRGVWERRSELALFRALGFRKLTLGWLVLAENGFLLLLGLGAGTAAALAAVAPHLAGGGAAVPWAPLLGLLGAALAVGLLAGAAAVAATLRAPLVPALRKE